MTLLDTLRDNVLLLVMPVFFLSTGLRTEWTVGGAPVFIAAGALLVAAVAGKLLGTRLAGRMLRLAAGRGLADRLAAADQGADHDHLRERAARQGHHHRHDLHGPAVDGRREHHAHRADRCAEAGTAAAVGTATPLDRGVRFPAASPAAGPARPGGRARCAGKFRNSIRAGSDSCRQDLGAAVLPRDRQRRQDLRPASDKRSAPGTR